MIVRTYGRRKIGRTLSETSLDDDVLAMEEEEDDDPFTFRETTTTTTTSTSYSLSFSQFQESPQEIGNFTFSSQDSTRWVNSDSENNNNNNNDSRNSGLQLLKTKKKGCGRREKVRRLSDGRREREREKEEVSLSMPKTTSLMETQEYGEMMECMDEVDFALDGLRRGQGVRVRRASLLSLLNLSASSHQRRLLKSQG